ncbi:CoB--CoM heterodisulfide reductase iron-sulfur subunit B family protein [Desulforhopalus singaporensis]|uniref:Heterodisulfide reductase subunit B n=1 Tax=Desulforhopalus singaporensis TaxID=91360 RepID=A0A1H0LG93_9BACT|nr:heterodisulfide reductase-related iron-sulfur binding cluster [Desulforhopalus singaporensis]SDO67238.1 heterodisulfide reductase subunit B [Desulforhopalus singaporensis]
MKLSYYPGCSLHGTALDYDQSVQRVCRQVGVELVEIPDWNCCGASSAHMTDHEIGMRLPMRNLVIAQELGNDILVPCAACFQRLKAADIELRRRPEYWDVKSYSPEMKIIHIATFLAQEQILGRIGASTKRALGGLPVACYYGCLSLRNPKITGAEKWEMPENLEKVSAALGARPVRWSHRTECCSGSLTMARPDIAEKLVGDIVAAARRGGASAMVTDCPMCQANVESRQDPAGEEEAIPVFYITELIEAAFNGDYSRRQQGQHLVTASVLADLFAGDSLHKED